MKEYDVRYTTLPNEVRSLNIHIPDRDLAVCKVFVKAGPVNESQKEHGISHKLEHVLYKGTERKSEEEWSLAADRLGTGQEAFTEKEYTAFSVEVLAGRLPKSMALLAEVLSKPGFPRGPIKLENDVLVGEMSDYKDDGSSRVEELFESLLYDGKTGMARSILGTKKSVRAQTRGDLKKYMGRWYRGENVLVVLSGKVNRMGKLVEENFGSLPPGPVEESNGIVKYGKPGIKVIMEATNQVHFILGVPGVPMGDSRFFSQQVMEVILGGHSVFDEHTIPSSLLYNLIRVKRGSAYDISAVSYSGKQAGYFGIRGKVQPRLFRDTLGLVQDEMFGLASKITKEDVARAKEFLKYYYARKVERTTDVAQLMGFSALMFDVVLQPAEVLKRIESVGLNDIRKIASEILIPEQTRLAVLGPINENLKWVRGLK